MKDSVTYQANVEEGKIDDLLRLGQRRFGAPSIAAEAALRAITDVERLARLIDRLLDASSWEELLSTP